MQRRILSSGWTSFYKFFGPAMVVLGVVYFIWITTMAAWREMPYGIFVFMSVVFAVNFGWLAWFSTRVMWVEIDERTKHLFLIR